MAPESLGTLFGDDVLKRLFPPTKADEFFEALLGDAEEGSFDIHLGFSDYLSQEGRLIFELKLSERPGKCLACNLTYGLPDVFSRHPVINIKRIVDEIEGVLGGKAKCKDWRLGRTQSVSRSLHVIPLIVNLEN